MAIVQQELVERKRWLTREEFIEEWAVAQIMPGPNVVNLSIMMGRRFFGMPGAFCAAAGMLLVPFLLILLLGLGYAAYGQDPRVLGAMRGMGAVAAGLVVAVGIRLFGALKSNVLGSPTCIALGVLSFICVGLLHWPLSYALLGIGGLACVLAYRKLKP